MRQASCIWVAGTAWTVGLTALVAEHFHPSQAAIITARTIFGLVSCASLSFVLLQKLRAGTSELEMYLFIRVMSRWVYILMYALALVRVCLYIYDVNQTCVHCHPGDAMAPIRSIDDIQFYIAFIVGPLWLVRAIVLVGPSWATPQSETRATTRRT
jgi:hypothetical protein